MLLRYHNIFLSWIFVTITGRVAIQLPGEDWFCVKSTYCYYAGSVKVTHSEAVRLCGEWDANLAQLETEYEAVLLSIFYKRYGDECCSYWIGLERGVSGQWQWSVDITGQTLAYTKFAAGQEDIATNTVGLMDPKTNLWITAVPTSKHHYLCEIPNGEKTTTTTPTTTTPATTISATTTPTSTTPSTTTTSTPTETIPATTTLTTTTPRISTTTQSVTTIPITTQNTMTTTPAVTIPATTTPTTTTPSISTPTQFVTTIPITTPADTIPATTTPTTTTPSPTTTSTSDTIIPSDTTLPTTTSITSNTHMPPTTTTPDQTTLRITTTTTITTIQTTTPTTTTTGTTKATTTTKTTTITITNNTQTTSTTKRPENTENLNLPIILEKKNTALYTTRSKYTRADRRPSAIAVGILALTVIAAIIGMIICLDVKALRYSCRFLKVNCRSVRCNRALARKCCHDRAKDRRAILVDRPMENFDGVSRDGVESGSSNASMETEIDVVE